MLFYGGRHGRCTGSSLNLTSKPLQVAVSFSAPIAPLASSTITAVTAERSLPFRAGERRRRRLRELAGGPVGVTAAAEGASSVVAEGGVDCALRKHDTQMQTDLKLCTKGYQTETGCCSSVLNPAN